MTQSSRSACEWLSSKSNKKQIDAQTDELTAVAQQRDKLPHEVDKVHQSELTYWQLTFTHGNIHKAVLRTWALCSPRNQAATTSRLWQSPVRYACGEVKVWMCICVLVLFRVRSVVVMRNVMYDDVTQCTGQGHSATSKQTEEWSTIPTAIIAIKYDHHDGIASQLTHELTEWGQVMWDDTQAPKPTRKQQVLIGCRRYCVWANVTLFDVKQT